MKIGNLNKEGKGVENKTSLKPYRFMLRHAMVDFF